MAGEYETEKRTAYARTVKSGDRAWLSVDGNVI